MEYPVLPPMNVSEETVNQYIERVLENSHEWKDLEGVQMTMNGIDEGDQIIRANDIYIRSLYLCLGKALASHTEQAKAHAASMREAAHT
jgi:hypothetical protein